MGESIIYILNCEIYCFTFYIYSICLIDHFVFVYDIHHIDFNIRMLWLWWHHVLGDWTWDFLNKAYLNCPAWKFIFLQLISIAQEFIEGFKMLWKFSSGFFSKFWSVSWKVFIEEANVYDKLLLLSCILEVLKLLVYLLLFMHVGILDLEWGL